MSTYDTIVIGGGHNGLTAATVLAKKGKNVLLLEKQGKPGGLAVNPNGKVEKAFGGVLYDTSAVRKPIIKELVLEKFGLELTGKRVDAILLGKEGQSLLRTGDIRETASRITEYSQKDADAYIRFQGFIDKITPLLSGLMNEVPPDMKNVGMKELWSLGKKAVGLKLLGNETMLEFLRIAPMCVADYLNEWFETDFLKAGLAAPAVYGSFTGPWSAGTNLNFLIYECLAKEEVLGGGPALISALVKAAESSGVEIRMNSEVTNIIIENGKATGVKIGNELIHAKILLSSCSPKQTMLEWIAPAEVNYDTEVQLNVLRSRGTTAIINLSYDKQVQFNSGGQSGALYRTGNTFDEMERAFDNSKYREYSEHPLLEIRVSEDGKVLNILTHYAPFDLKGGWTDEAKAGLLENVKEELSLYISAQAQLQDAEVISPSEIDQRYGIPGGHIFHAEHAIDQLITRPFPSFMQYKTTIPGLYHCGSGAHPGGGLTCAPGFLAASSL